MFMSHSFSTFHSKSIIVLLVLGMPLSPPCSLYSILKEHMQEISSWPILLVVLKIQGYTTDLKPFINMEMNMMKWNQPSNRKCRVSLPLDLRELQQAGL